MRAHIQIPHSNGAHTLSGRFCELCDRNQAAVRGAQSANFLYIDKNVGAKISSRHVHMLRKRHGKLCRRLIWGQRRSDVSLCFMRGMLIYLGDAHPHVAPKQRGKRWDTFSALPSPNTRARPHEEYILEKLSGSHFLYTRSRSWALRKISVYYTRPPRWCSSSLSLQHARKGTIGGPRETLILTRVNSGWKRNDKKLFKRGWTFDPLLTHANHLRAVRGAVHFAYLALLSKMFKIWV